MRHLFALHLARHNTVQRGDDETSILRRAGEVRDLRVPSARAPCWRSRAGSHWARRSLPPAPLHCYLAAGEDDPVDERLHGVFNSFKSWGTKSQISENRFVFGCFRHMSI